MISRNRDPQAIGGGIFLSHISKEKILKKLGLSRAKISQPNSPKISNFQSKKISFQTQFIANNNASG